MDSEKTMGRDRYLAINESRRVIYAFLSKMYEEEITLDLLKELSSEDSPIFRIGRSEDLDDEELKRGFEMLARYLNLGSRDLNEVKLELAAEYASLFLGVKGRPPHPSESVYVSSDHTVSQESRDQVMYAYWKAGVDKVKKYTEPEDHIAIELQFMEYLCRKTIEAVDGIRKDEAKKYLQVQKEFIDNHLAKWVPEFTKDVLESADEDFYRGIAHITRAFIELERTAIPFLIEDKGLSS